ncbi:hypothetical protein BC940DRAFT_313201 [Gongronella butleri]|nr:hypothetical protein BC940DRAFT_313201 [Gongronella butleri]
MDDNIWGSSDDDVEYERNLAEKEWNQLQEDHGNVGYKVGIIEGQEVHMQKGFDRGYVEGLDIGLQLGKLQGKLSAYVAYYEQHEHDDAILQQLKPLLQELTQVDVDTLFSKAYFQPDTSDSVDDASSPHAILRQWQQRIDATLQPLAAAANISSSS